MMTQWNKRRAEELDRSCRNDTEAQEPTPGWVYSLAVGGGCYLPVRVERDLGDGRWSGTVLRGGGMLGLPDGELPGQVFRAGDLKNGRPEAEWRRRQERLSHGCPELRDLIREVLSPEAVAFIAEVLETSPRSGDGAIDCQVRWFAEELARILDE